PASTREPRFCTVRCLATLYVERALRNAFAGTARPRLAQSRPGQPRGRGYLGACAEPRFTTPCRKTTRGQRPSNGSDAKLQAAFTCERTERRAACRDAHAFDV